MIAPHDLLRDSLAKIHADPGIAWREFQSLVVDLIESDSAHYSVENKGGIGPDGQKDALIICRLSEPTQFEERWVVQCKWTGNPDLKLSADEVRNIPEICTRHEAVGYLLVSNALMPTETMSQNIQGYKGTFRTIFKAAYWFFPVLANRLLGPTGIDLCRRRFPDVALALDAAQDKFGWKDKLHRVALASPNSPEEARSLIEGLLKELK